MARSCASPLRSSVRLLTLTALAVLAVAAVAAWVVETEPDVYLRARYPLEYEHIVRAHARNYDLDPALARRGRLRREPVRPERGVGGGRDRPHAAPAGHREGDRAPHRRRPLRRRRSARPGDQRPLRLVVPRPPARAVPATRSSRSPRTTRARGTSTTGGRRDSGSRSPRRASYVAEVERLRSVYADAYRDRARPPIASSRRPTTSSTRGGSSPCARWSASPLSTRFTNAADLARLEVVAELARPLRLPRRGRG